MPSNSDFHPWDLAFLLFPPSFHNTIRVRCNLFATCDWCFCYGSVICPFYCMWHNNIQFTWANIHFRWIITFRAIIHCSWSVFCEWQSLIKVFFSSKNSNNSKNEMRLSFECSVLRVTMALQSTQSMIVL